jgi:hypothetical protein
MPSLRLHTVLLALFATSTPACKSTGPASTPLPSSSPGLPDTIPGDSSAGARSTPALESLAHEAELDDHASAHRRPGLGTEYGEQRPSSIVPRRFVRGRSTPDVVLSMFYDDFAGVRARGHSDFSSASSRVATPDGALALTVVDERGRTLPAAQIGAKRIVVGEVGQRYRIGVENGSTQSFEVVVSVDGLDVMDGDEAGFTKRGYIAPPLSSVMIDGWRTSTDTVAAFRFSSIEESYADRTGRPRNVGVIGVAFFHEEGGMPWEELQRENADPFPNRFAPPPPPRRAVL